MVGRSDDHDTQNAPTNEFGDLIGLYHDLHLGLQGLGCQHYSRVVGCDQQGCSGIEKKDPGSIFLLRPILLD